MERKTNGLGTQSSVANRVLCGLLLFLVYALPAAAKVPIDFDPSLDYTKFKTYAYIGGVEHLMALQVNPELIGDRVHQAVSRELNNRGLKEVKPEQNPDLVVRYWRTANPSSMWLPRTIGDPMARILGPIGDICTTPCRRPPPGKGLW